MRCSNCQSTMFGAEIVIEGCTEQTLFECPTCSRTHLYSRRLSVHESSKCQSRRQGAYRVKAAAVAG